MKLGIDGRAAKWYRGTGIGTYTYQLINYLNKIDRINEYLLFMPSSCKYDTPMGANFNVSSITDGDVGTFWDEVNVPNILKNSDVELYHVPQNGVGLPEDKTNAFTITLHDVIPYKMPQTCSSSYLKIFTEKMPKIVSRCDGIITVSNHSKKDIMETLNVPSDKIFVTPLASEDIYRPLDKKLSRQVVDTNYSINSDYVLYVGGFSPRKNILGLIEAFSKLVLCYKKDIKLVIAGKHGLSYEIYKNRAHSLGLEGKVLFPGFIPIEHLPYMYNACSLFVYPSFYEGYGLPTIEAMSCGVPIVASKDTSIPEVVGKGALLIDPYNIDQLCDAMYKVLSDFNLRQELILHALVKASEYSWENTAKHTLIAYNKILNKC